MESPRPAVATTAFGLEQRLAHGLLVSLAVLASPGGSVRIERVGAVLDRVKAGAAESTKLKALTEHFAVRFTLSGGWHSPQLHEASDAAVGLGYVTVEQGSLSVTDAFRCVADDLALSRRERAALAGAASLMSVVV